MKRPTTVAICLAVCLSAAAGSVRAGGIGLPAREALASMLPIGNLIVYGTVVDTVDNVYDYFPAGEFAKYAGAPKGSRIRFVHVRVDVKRVLRGRTSGREITFGLPVEFIPAPDSTGSAGPPVDRAAIARLRASVAPGTSAVFPLMLEPRAPGSWLLLSTDHVVPETNGKIAGETIADFSLAAREFYDRRQLPALTLAADAIVMATVRTVRGGCETHRDTTFACVDLSVDRYLKSETDTLITVLVPDPLGTSWRTPIVREDIPQLTEGEQHIFLLRRSPDGRWRLGEGRSGVLHTERTWISEFPRDAGPVYGLNMSADSFEIWITHVLERAAEGKSIE